MSFKWLWFDIDNTLLDFENASKQAFYQSFQDFNVPYQQHYYDIYHDINVKVWSDFEAAKINAERLRIKRFEDFLLAIDISEILPDKFSSRYLENLVVKSETYENVHNLIANWHKKYLLSVVTNGLKEVQRPRLDKLNLSKYFRSIVVSDEIGCAKPHFDYFQVVFNSVEHSLKKEEILIIGDNLYSDILGGLNFGIRTCWLSHSRSNESEIDPHYVINNIQELDTIL